MTFTRLGLAEPILEGVKAAGYTQPTEIQSLAIPRVLRGEDLIALGQTGSGKTAAFGLPILTRLCGGPPGLRAVILVPTRELCVQVAENLRVYAQHAGLHVCTAFGGIPLAIQESAFKRGLDVLVACPGRLIDHLERGNLVLKDVQVMVLDEADRMLDMGFLPQIRRIFVRCPQERQNLLFSATMPPEIESLVKDFMGKAQRVQVGQRSQAAASIRHEFLEVASDHKLATLEQILRRTRGRVLVFVKTKIRCEQLGRALKAKRLPADAIHGDKSAEARYAVLQSFERGKVLALVATDVAARGIDVSGIELVVNYDLPHSVEDYVHRTGRTGRAGAEGRALTLVGPADRGKVRQIQDHLARTSRAVPAPHPRGTLAAVPEPQRAGPAPRPDGGPDRASQGAGGTARKREPERGGHRSGHHGEGDRTRHREGSGRGHGHPESKRPEGRRAAPSGRASGSGNGHPAPRRDPHPHARRGDATVLEPAPAPAGSHAGRAVAHPRPPVPAGR